MPRRNALFMQNNGRDQIENTLLYECVRCQSHGRDSGAGRCGFGLENSGIKCRIENVTTFITLFWILELHGKLFLRAVLKKNKIQIAFNELRIHLSKYPGSIGLDTQAVSRATPYQNYRYSSPRPLHFQK